MRVRMLIALAVAVVIVAIGLGVRSALVPGRAESQAVTASKTLSPHEIHLNYKALKELPVHDSTNAH
jgi:hypothetical protein